ncbi:MAG: hypothetical protein WAU37_03610 [Formosimonas sp.]|jgi:hypothetical protein
MKKIHFVATAMLLAITQSAFAGQGCKDNFDDMGDEDVGRVFKSTELVEGVAVSDAIKRVNKSLRFEGWKIKSVGKTAIYAYNLVANNSKKTNPLTINFDAKEGGVKVSMIYRTGPGINVNKSDVKKQFCSITNSAADK